jgi:hypothetical protein
MGKFWQERNNHTLDKVEMNGNSLKSNVLKFIIWQVARFGRHTELYLLGFHCSFEFSILICWEEVPQSSCTLIILLFWMIVYWLIKKIIKFKTKWTWNHVVAKIWQLNSKPFKGSRPFMRPLKPFHPPLKLGTRN